MFCWPLSSWLISGRRNFPKQTGSSWRRRLSCIRRTACTGWLNNGRKKFEDLKIRRFENGTFFMGIIVNMQIRKSVNSSFASLRLCALLFFALGIVSCSQSDKPTFTDTPTSGEVTVACDESYQRILQVEADTFMGLYKYAKVHVKYLPEAQLFEQLVNNDSIRFVVAARTLNKDEQEAFDRRKLFPKTVKIAVDAVTLIVHNDNPDSLLRYEQVQDIVRGKIAAWGQLHGSASSDSIRIVFDRNG